MASHNWLLWRGCSFLARRWRGNYYLPVPLYVKCYQYFNSAGYYPGIGPLNISVILAGYPILTQG
jgi:hypothetical protein